ncbi:hypothetical protein FSPOR_11924 [Fusarium sporotrichioides]|uniref:WSC domain-containing protein n=1 Tax=Fusarium sporotrichioides TaxID=5514 RepID=A0A395RDG1_FUSSP|nr:hypothetical protein FSPOR_11924 [Fusarium sporotrichioides]
MGALISVVSSYDPEEVAGAIFNGAGVTVLDATWLRIAEAEFSPAGTFSIGPYGIGSGGILTNGVAERASDEFNPAFQPNVNNEFPGSAQYCGSGTFDATVLQVTIDIADNFNGVEVEFILSSMEYTQGRPDPIGIYLDDVLWSIDDSFQRITATSKYLNEEIGINEQEKNDIEGNGAINRATRYDGSSPPLLVGIPATPGEHTMVFAICDTIDGDWDSGLLVKAKGCRDCDPKVRINYVSTTTSTGSTSFTSTIKAVGTESGTVLFGVPAEETTTTTEDGTTTTMGISTTKEFSTATHTTMTTESQEFSTVTSGTTYTDSTTLTSDQSSTATTAAASTTTASTTTAVTDAARSSETTSMASLEPSTLEYSSTTESFVDISSSGSEGSTTLLESSIVSDQRTVSTSIIGSETTSTSSEVSPSGLPTTASTGETTQSNPTDTTSLDNVQTTQSTEESNSLTPTVPDSTSSASQPTDTINPTNLEVIGSFTFLGCLGSPDGYPSFDLVATTDDMTPSKCVSLATGRLYVGVYDSSCYASDSLESTTVVGEGECDIPCPNAPLLFCGGLVGTGRTSNDASQRRYRHRRDAPRNVLLTLYGARDAGDTSSGGLVTGTFTAPSISEAIGETSVITGDVSASVIESITSEAGPDVITLPTASSFQFPITSGQAVPFPPNRPVPSSGWLGKNNMTQIVEPVVTISTITYTIVDPKNPATFKVEKYCSTIQYYPCHRLPAAVARPTDIDSLEHPGYPPQHGSEPFVESPFETGLHHAKLAILAKPTKAYYDALPPVPEKNDFTDKPDSLNGNQPQVYPQDTAPKEPQVEAPKITANEPKPVDQVHPTSRFVGGYDIKTSTLPTWYVPSEVPVVVSAATMSFPMLGSIFFVFAFASVLNSV